MELEISTVIREYQNFFSEQSEGKPCSFYGPPGSPNRAFFYRLFMGDEETLHDFLTDASLVISSSKCWQCGNDMKLIKSKRAYGQEWYCGRYRPEGRCRTVKSFLYGSFFYRSQLQIGTLLQLVYELFRGSSVNSIHRDIGVFTHCITYYRQYITEVLVHFIVTNTEKIGGTGKIVEIYESKTGKNKFNKSQSYFDGGQWVFGGTERVSGRCFLVAIPDRSAETLLGLIEKWIEPESEIISNCWKEDDRLGEQAVDHLRINRSIHFIESEAETLTTTEETSSQPFKTFMPEHKKLKDFRGNVVWFMFWKICESLKLDPFVKFLDIVQSIDWIRWDKNATGAKEESME